MRKLGASLLALPVIARLYLAALGRVGIGRTIPVSAVALLVALSLTAGTGPAPSRAIPARPEPRPVDARVLEALGTGHGLRQPLRVEFDAPMDPASVAAAMQLVPDAAVSFGWDPAGRVLTIRPERAWRPDTLYVLTVSTSARAANGGVLASPVRAAVLTARAGSGAIVATRLSATRARIDTAFRIVLDRAVPLGDVRRALRVDPPVEGTLTGSATPGEFLFTPEAPLAADARYALVLDGLVDEDGIPFAADPGLELRTARAPRVVRFRPGDGAAAVQRTSAISVRFTERMDRAATSGALSVTVAGRAVPGDVSWAEGGTVLVFVPDAPLPYGARVEATVGERARSRAGTPIAAAVVVDFTVEAKPKPKPKPRPTAPRAPSGGRDTSIPRSGGGGAVSGNWAGVESYYLRLMNCTRTGGWVTSKGRCSSPGGRDVRPLTMNSGISAKVARPYAKLLATRNICSHFVGGNPGDRLRRAGYTSYRWGENLGCRSGNPYSAVLGSHLYFQSEKPYNGGHYRNLMDARYRQAGIGVWVSGGRVRLVVDFYTP